MNHLLVSHIISISHWSRKHQLKLTMTGKEIGMSLYIEIHIDLDGLESVVNYLCLELGKMWRND